MKLMPSVLVSLTSTWRYVYYETDSISAQEKYASEREKYLIKNIEAYLVVFHSSEALDEINLFWLRHIKGT